MATVTETTNQPVDSAPPTDSGEPMDRFAVRLFLAFFALLGLLTVGEIVSYWFR
jgi:hypothetical protein